MSELLTYLVQSDLFDISYHTEKFNAVRGEKASIIYYNGKKVYFDVWEYLAPTYSNEVFNANFDLIIKLQHTNMSCDNFEKVCINKNLFADKTPEQRKMFFNKIVPWTFFCSRMMKQFIGKEEEIQPLPIERTAFFCGKSWKCRGWSKAQLEKEKIEYTSSDQATHTLPLNDEEYLYKMKTSKYGLILHGRGSWLCEAKNRREIDYMMLKKPILLNYKPFYYNPLVEGKHYIYFDKNLEVKDIENKYDVKAIAENGYCWYKENASPLGSAQTFLKIMQEKC